MLGIQLRNGSDVAFPHTEEEADNFLLQSYDVDNMIPTIYLGLGKSSVPESLSRRS
jgi:hypothetical protein